MGWGATAAVGSAAMAVAARGVMAVVVRAGCIAWHTKVQEALQWKQDGSALAVGCPSQAEPSHSSRLTWVRAGWRLGEAGNAQEVEEGMHIQEGPAHTADP